MQKSIVKGISLFAAALVVVVSMPVMQAQAADTVLTVDKQVRNVTRGGTFADSTTAQAGDVLEYQTTIRNIGSQQANNAGMYDMFDNASLVTNRSNGSVSRSYSGSLTDTNPSLTFGNLEAGGTITVRYQVTLQSNAGSYSNVCNTATAAGTNVSSVTDRACATITTIGTNNQASQLSLVKEVRNVTQSGTFVSAVTARAGETVEYQIRVRNTGSNNVYNTVVTDSAVYPFTTRTNLTVSRGYSGQFDGSGIQFASLEPGAEATIRYQVLVPTAMTLNSSYCNTAAVRADVVASQSTTICVAIQNTVTTTGNTNAAVSRSVVVSNDTKNTRGAAVDAGREDYLTYTFTATNLTGALQYNVALQVDLSGVLPLVDVVDNGGGTITGSTITYPAQDMGVATTTTKTLRVRVKYFLPPYSYSLVTTFGNDVRVNIPAQGATPTTFVAPKTGGNTLPLVATGMGLLAVALFALYRNPAFRKALFN